ncbi:hypothetical protein STRDD04_01148 [Streptococcus sp. DD04]|nr:hypothetical protein STRDD04_01148 [Streptococcus sp. DD04]
MEHRERAVDFETKHLSHLEYNLGVHTAVGQDLSLYAKQHPN